MAGTGAAILYLETEGMDARYREMRWKAPGSLMARPAPPTQDYDLKPSVEREINFCVKSLLFWVSLL